MKFIFRLVLVAIVFNGGIFLPSQELQAQDPRYTQYYNAPLRLNPAMAGVFEGLWRVGANFRTQWGSVMHKPYNTFAFTADGKLQAFKSDFVGLGFSAMSDISGQGMYNVTDINLSASYMKQLSGSRRSNRGAMTSYLVAGAQLGIGQRSVKWLNLTYSTQYYTDESGDGYDQNIYSGENPNRRDTKIYPDLSVGALWYGVMGPRKSVYAGFGLFHLNRPEISLFNRTAASASADIERLYMRITAHAGGELLVGGRGASLSLLPGFVGMFQGPSMELNMGLGIKYQRAKYDDFALRFSVWTRLANKLESSIDADALMLIVGLDYQTFQFGISYDINLSSLTAVSNGQGALEFSIIYTRDGSQQNRQEGCPTF
ncbi:MAG: PorP/SprF family type IX secretion system membrane protein [Saprospiraceae bacterium]|nr:PorP/SprF family type IX secretion system membrane protein [Saprospiraceae bacterium]